MNTYFGFAIADGMFPAGTFRKEVLTLEQVQAILEQGVISCVNPAHRSTIIALRHRFGLEVEVPDKAHKVNLIQGDRILVCTVIGLPRETREFTQEEIDRASLAFSLWLVEESNKALP